VGQIAIAEPPRIALSVCYGARPARRFCSRILGNADARFRSLHAALFEQRISSLEDAGRLTASAAVHASFARSAAAHASRVDDPPAPLWCYLRDLVRAYLELQVPRCECVNCGRWGPSMQHSASSQDRCSSRRQARIRRQACIP
jgi:Zn ribbon nucleic-acid-binding protein